MIKEVIRCGETLISNELSIAFAESATAGRLSAEFSLTPDAGKFLKGGIACYDASLKTSLLNVPKGLIETFTPESMEVTSSIAQGLASLIPARIHLGVTGLTCAGGSENAEKPIGTMFVVALLDGQKLFAQRFEFHGSEEEIVLATVIETAARLDTALRFYEADFS